MAIYLTSDTHYHHKNIIDYCDRPFSGVDDMNQCMVKWHNQTVNPSDTVWHLGDVAFGTGSRIAEILYALNGTIHLVLGNHDFKTLTPTLLKRFASVQHYAEINYEKTKIVMCHFPFETWNKAHKGSVHFHGHSHGNMPSTGKRRLDVGVDCHDFDPVPLDTAFKLAIKNGGKF